MKKKNNKYMINRSTYKNIKKYDHQQMEGYLTDVYKSGYHDGREALHGVKGIGPVVWQRIAERMVCMFADKKLNH